MSPFVFITKLKLRTLKALVPLRFLTCVAFLIFQDLQGINTLKVKFNNNKKVRVLARKERCD